MSKQQLQQRRARNKPRKQTKYSVTNTSPINPIYSTSIMPAQKYSKLYYNDGSTVRNNAGGNFLVYSMRINDLYDPDPALLSGSVSNFKEMMQFYSYYKVDSCDLTWTLINLETFPLSAGIVFTQSNLSGVISSLSDAQNALENDFTTGVRTISGKGGLDKTTFSITKFDIHRLLGNKQQYEGDINYSGLGLATPTVPFWANFIVWAPTGGTLSNGYANSTKLQFYSHFYGRTNNRA
jgi:hypothetical protein